MNKIKYLFLIISLFAYAGVNAQSKNDFLKEALGTKDVACIIDAKHLCVNCRGIKDTASSTITAELSGIFRTNPITRQEFLHYVGSHAKLD